jgi:hypothetical protein
VAIDRAAAPDQANARSGDVIHIDRLFKDWRERKIDRQLRWANLRAWILG